MLFISSSCILIECRCSFGVIVTIFNPHLPPTSVNRLSSINRDVGKLWLPQLRGGTSPPGGSSGIICRFMPFIQELDLGDEPFGSQANFASHVYLRVSIPSSTISITDALS